MLPHVQTVRCYQEKEISTTNVAVGKNVTPRLCGPVTRCPHLALDLDDGGQLTMGAIQREVSTSGHH